MIEKNLTQTCRIERYTYGEDSLGGRAVTGTEIVYEGKCFLTRVNRSGADMVAAAEQGRVYYTLNLPYDADIQDQDAVFIILENGAEEAYETAQVIRRQSVDVMRQAMIVRAGS